MARAVQDFVPIEEIREGVVMLKSGQMRMVLLASSVNFDLKSEDEQEAIILQYQNFLNSLDFPIQFFIESRKLDIRPYVTMVENRLKEQLNELIKVQTREYIEFIKNVTEKTNIMSKTFFIVVPLASSAMTGSRENFFSSLFKSKKATQLAKENFERFEENRSQLEQRRSVVVQGLARLGIRTVMLGTEELVELYYKIFNPGDANIPTAPQN
ncbi:MAG TPA: hypothetical protein VJI73_04170 [Candidatus Paceibacterota bacterium]